MRFKDKYFPYPVIRPFKEDFQESTFDIELSQETIDNTMIIKGSIKMNNNSILREIEHGNVKYALHLEESETMFREIYYFSEQSFEVNVSLDKIRSTVEVVPFIIAVNDIKNFKSDDLIGIFDGLTIDYDANNIIGVGSPMKIDVVKENDDIEAINSIFMVVPNEDITNIFELTLERERIKIKVSEKTFKLYNQMSKNYQITNSNDNIVLLTLMVLPVFIETLNRLKNSSEMCKEYIWYDPLIEAFNKKGIDILNEFEKDNFDAYKNAQIIFEEILSKSINQLKYLSFEKGQ